MEPKQKFASLPWKIAGFVMAAAPSRVVRPKLARPATVMDR